MEGYHESSQQVAQTHTLRKEEKRSKLLYALALAALFLTFLINSYVIIATSLKPNVIEFKNTPYVVSPSKIHPGDVVKVRVDYCKHKKVFADLTILFVGRALVPSVQSRTILPVGCHIEDVEVAIPSSVPDGEWSMIFRLQYREGLFPLQHANYEFETETFTVEK